MDPTLAELARLRALHETAGLDPADLAADPIVQFERWHAQWRSLWIDEPDAMTVATADEHGRPSARTVLLRGLDQRGFVFFTSYESRKGRDLAANPWATLLFAWVPIRRQVVVSGAVERCSDEESDAYFASRDRARQISAWASEQSREIPDRATLADRHRSYEERFEGREVPRPPHWGGLRVVPNDVELWQGRPDRLHDRLRYTRVGGAWTISRLAP